MPENFVLQPLNAWLLAFHGGEATGEVVGFLSIQPHQLEHLQLRLNCAFNAGVSMFLLFQQDFQGLHRCVLPLALRIQAAALLPYFSQHGILPLLRFNVAVSRHFQNIDNITNLFANIIQALFLPGNSFALPGNSFTLLGNSFALPGNSFTLPVEHGNYLRNLLALLVLLASQVNQEAL